MFDPDQGECVRALEDGSRSFQMESPIPMTSRKTFRLALRDGSSWRFMGDHHTLWMVDKLATIMELKQSDINGAAKLIFCNRGRKNEILNGMIYAEKSELRSSVKGDGQPFYDYNTLRVWYHQNIPDVICEVKDIRDPEIEFLNMWFALHPVYQESINRGGLPFHAALVKWNGRGLLLAAPGDSGKTTCCGRLPDNWRPLCDDETLVVLNQNGNYDAHPFPTWSDYLLKRRETKTWNVACSAPLAGVFFLEQSENDAVEPLGEGRAAVLMTESATQVCQKFWTKCSNEDQRRFREELFNNACEMARKISAYHLGVSLHGRFWEKMEQAIGF